MSQPRWGKVRDSTVPVLLGTLIVAMFYTTTSIHDRMAGMESRLGDRIHRMEKELSDRISRMEKELERITRLETVLEEPEVTPAEAVGPASTPSAPFRRLAAAMPVWNLAVTFRTAIQWV